MSYQLFTQPLHLSLLLVVRYFWVIIKINHFNKTLGLLYWLWFATGMRLLNYLIQKPSSETLDPRFVTWTSVMFCWIEIWWLWRSLEYRELIDMVRKSVWKGLKLCDRVISCWKWPSEGIRGSKCAKKNPSPQIRPWKCRRYHLL